MGGGIPPLKIMPIKFANEGQQQNLDTADQTYYLDEQGNVTTDTNKAATVLINKGQDVPPDMAAKYDLGGKVAQTEGPAAPDGEVATDDDAAEPKAAKPSANKAAKPARNKGVK